MDRRLALHEVLADILGSRNVYFQPPSTIQMGKPPWIVYGLADRNFLTRFAGDTLYFLSKPYKVTVIDRDPDSGIPDKLLKLPYCSFDRFYTADGLNHFVFTLYY